MLRGNGGHPGHAITLFNYLADKDIFMLLYSKKLMHRLIWNKFISIEAESNFIDRMITIQGLDYCRHLKRMIRDQQEWQPINTIFQQSTPLPFTLHICVLGTAFWPTTHERVGFQPPTEVQNALELFRTHYVLRYPSRKLNYVHHLSRGDILISSKTTLHTTAHQIGMLMMFADQKVTKLTALEICNGTGIDFAIVKKMPLLTQGNEILLASEEKNKWTLETVFYINPTFTCDQSELTDTTECASLHVTEEEQSTSERESLIKLQSKIVKVVQYHKVMTHEKLITELPKYTSWSFNILSFTQFQIKQAIATLIDQEYLRYTSQTDTYEYIA
jgi:cullin 1